jgi:hypothetical protein
VPLHRPSADVELGEGVAVEAVTSMRRGTTLAEGTVVVIVEVV